MASLTLLPADAGDTVGSASTPPVIHIVDHYTARMVTKASCPAIPNAYMSVLPNVYQQKGDLGGEFEVVFVGAFEIPCDGEKHAVRHPMFNDSNDTENDTLHPGVGFADVIWSVCTPEGCERGGSQPLRSIIVSDR